MARDACVVVRFHVFGASAALVSCCLCVRADGRYSAMRASKALTSGLYSFLSCVNRSIFFLGDVASVDARALFVCFKSPCRRSERDFCEF